MNSNEFLIYSFTESPRMHMQGSALCGGGHRSTVRPRSTVTAASGFRGADGLPDMGGPDVCGRLCTRSAVPIVMITARLSTGVGQAPATGASSRSGSVPVPAVSLRPRRRCSTW